MQHENFRIEDLKYKADEKISQRILKLQKEFNKKFNPTDQKKIAFSHKVDYVYNTVALEGNTYNYIETETLLSGVTVGGHTVKEANEILNQKEAWEFTLNNAFAQPSIMVSENLIKDIHWRVGKDTVVDPGQYRTGRVKIGGTDYVPPKTRTEIFLQLENFLQDFAKLKIDVYLKAIIIHFVTALIQPFYDGNKRTARLLMNFIFLQNNYPLLSIPVKARQEYVVAMLKGYETLDLNELIKLISDLVIKNLEEYNQSR
jgi:Fic family protein